MNSTDHYRKIGDYYNRTTEAWIETYRRTQSFRFDQYLDKHDEILESKIFFKKDGIYLDAGCGDFSFSQKICKKNKKIKIFGVTLSDKQVEIAKPRCLENCNIFKQNFETLDFLDNSFDGCFFVESFSHAINKEKVCKEIKRVVKNNGRIYILDLNLEKDVRKDKIYWGWYNIFYFLPIKYRKSLKIFEKYFIISKTSTNIKNYRKDFYKKLRPNVNFMNCECTYNNSDSLTEYGKYHNLQNTYNLPVVWSEFSMINQK
jgi:ubiquinone/menaquinone biosynthesis C-methylase UbiE